MKTKFFSAKSHGLESRLPVSLPNLGISAKQRESGCAGGITLSVRIQKRDSSEPERRLIAGAALRAIAGEVENL